MSDLLVYVHDARAEAARALLGQACASTGMSVRLEVLGSGSMYQRLGARRAPPAPDLVWWFGPFAAHAAASDGLLQTYQQQPWLAMDSSTIGVVGSPAVASWQDLANVPRLAMADPERSEVGLSILLASLDRARQIDGDLEAGWRWWQQRAALGLRLAEDDPGAVALVQSGAATHALTLAPDAVALAELAPLPHAVGLAANSRNMDAARSLLDWLSARATTSPAPSLDVEWATGQYVATRQRWAQGGFAPGVTG